MRANGRASGVAVRASREAGPRDAAPFLLAEIDDDGPGLDEGARAEALERGKRLDESRPGSGLGLSIVVELAAIYGGLARDWTTVRSAACAQFCGCRACEASRRLGLELINETWVHANAGDRRAMPRRLFRARNERRTAGLAAGRRARRRRRRRRQFRPAPALGGVLGGPVGASLSEADREAAWRRRSLRSIRAKRRSWRGAHGVFGFVEPGAETGAGCRAYSQTIYVAGRPNRGQGVGCKQPDGSWKMTN